MLANGVFAGAELALLTVRKTRLRELLDEGSRAARVIATLRANPERLLATVQIGITVVSSTAAAFGGASLAHPLAGLLARLGLAGPRRSASPSPWWWARSPSCRWCWASWCPSRWPCATRSGTR